VKRGVGIIVLAAVVIAAAMLLVPGVATFVGGLIASLWITVMGAVAGILGGILGA